MAKAASNVLFSDQYLDKADFNAALRILDEGLIENETTLQQEINQGHTELEEDLSEIAKVKM